MSDQPDTDDAARSVERRTVLRGAAATVGGLAAVGGTAGAREFDGSVRTRGRLTPGEAARKLQQLDEFDGLPAQDDPCYTDTKCSGGCGYQGAVAYRTCCPQLGGCGSWNYTGLCC